MSQEKKIVIEEYPGDRYPSLKMAQEALLPVLAKLLVAAIREGLDNGRFKVVDRKVVWAIDNTGKGGDAPGS